MTPEVPRNVNDALTLGLVVACYYTAHPEAPVDRPDCEGLAFVRYGTIPLCPDCDRRRSAVGKGMAPVPLPDPLSLIEVMTARDRVAEAERPWPGPCPRLETLDIPGRPSGRCSEPPARAPSNASPGSPSTTRRKVPGGEGQ